MNPITFIDYSNPESYKKAKTEFVMFIHKGETFNPLVDSELYQVYESNPNFRKLSMVAPVISTAVSLIYGWTITGNFASPKYFASSTQPYAIQVGSITGSVIRTAALEKLDYQFYGDRLADSILFSLALWESGQMVYLAPKIIREGSNVLDMSGTVDIDPKLLARFKREMIG